MNIITVPRTFCNLFTLTFSPLDKQTTVSKRIYQLWNSNGIVKFSGDRGPAFMNFPFIIELQMK